LGDGSIKGFSMTNKREGDLELHGKFRTNRFFQDSCAWYFLTREGTVEGPFERKIDAENRLEDYVKVMIADLLPEIELSLKPL
jgi:hypothetical protein